MNDLRFGLSVHFSLVFDGKDITYLILLESLKPQLFKNIQKFSVDLSQYELEAPEGSHMDHFSTHSYREIFKVNVYFAIIEVVANKSN